MNTPVQQLQRLRRDLAARFPERREVIEGALYALLSAEHILLLGPPGSAKSALARALAQAFGARYFERLLTKFSTPEELFGPVSLKALENDRYTRITAGKLPEAEIGVIDETFRANSAILNALLALMNERLFHNDGAPTACPLVTLFGASNDLPDGKELEALFDRFLLRYEVSYVLRPSSLRAVLTAPDPTSPASLTMEQLRAAQAEVLSVTVTDETIDALLAIREQCKAEGIVASDRRWKKCLKAARASAYLAGESKTSPEDLSLLTDCLWREPKERPKVARVVGKLADPVGSQALEILDAARETSARVSALQLSDRRSYLSAATNALEEFNAQQAKLADLAKSAARRAKQAIADATSEILQLHTELARIVATGLRIGGAR
ncbi:MAG: ATPase [Anaeromyxobacter sp. RBG_16_69_14]|nr:MAG: ATPase [Anaeromyxobacter sp. RBG_16_69_14]